MAASRAGVSGHCATQEAAACGEFCAQRCTMATAARSCSCPASRAFAASVAAAAPSCSAEATATAASRRCRRLASETFAAQSVSRGGIGPAPLADGVNEQIITRRRRSQSTRHFERHHRLAPRGFVSQGSEPPPAWRRRRARPQPSRWRRAGRCWPKRWRLARARHGTVDREEVARPMLRPQARPLRPSGGRGAGLIRQPQDGCHARANRAPRAGQHQRRNQPRLRELRFCGQGRSRLRRPREERLRRHGLGWVAEQRGTSSVVRDVRCGMR